VPQRQPGAQPPAGMQPGQPPQRPRPVPRPQQPGQLPPGHPPVPGQQPPPPESPAKAHGGHCPGHGPYDPPPHINWYQGILGVDNEKARSPRFLDRLLWRYKNDKDECDPKNQEPPLVAAFFNFFVLMFVLYRFGKKPLMDGLAKRKRGIMHDIEAADALKVQSEERLKNYERQMSRIEERRKELEEEHRQQWEIEKKRILEEARDKSERLRRDARFRVEQELKQARIDLTRASVDAAVAAAEELVQARIEKTDQDRLADAYLTGVGTLFRAGAPSGAAQGRQS
jgi:F-type H+-transporting ATPase subunit b